MTKEKIDRIINIVPLATKEEQEKANEDFEKEYKATTLYNEETGEETEVIYLRNSLYEKLAAAAEEAGQTPGLYLFNILKEQTGIDQEQTDVEKQNKGREERRQMKKGAQEINAIMEIKGGNYPIFSNRTLLDAFSPTRLFKLGSIDNNVIDPDTGEINNIKAEDLELISANNISSNAFYLINACIENSVDNVREELIENGQITFYVDGILKAFTEDPRTLVDKQLNLDRKTAGAIYLEDLFKPLVGLVGQMPNGSRWSVLNYIGYDATTDTMTISSPYINQLWRTTQGAYFKRQRNKEAALKANKKPTKDDLKPLEINKYFKNKAITEDPITVEIAIYITNVLLNAGNSGKPKRTEIKYKSIIKNCPKLRERLEEIENKRGVKNEKGKSINIAAYQNKEFKKIARAFKLIQDPEKCDFLNDYDFIEITPAKHKDNSNNFEVTPPTKSNINDKITIYWKRKTPNK